MKRGFPQRYDSQYSIPQHTEIPTVTYKQVIKLDFEEIRLKKIQGKSQTLKIRGSPLLIRDHSENIENQNFIQNQDAKLLTFSFEFCWKFFCEAL